MAPRLLRAAPLLVLVIPLLLVLAPGAHLAAEDLVYRPAARFGALAGDRLEWPEGVAFDATGNLYLADSGLNLVQKYDGSATLLARWGNVPRGGANLRLTLPTGVAAGPDGSVYVADTAQRTVRIFDSRGSLTGSFGGAGAGDGALQAPVAVAADPAGNVYVADRDANAVQKFNAAGKFLLKWGSRGKDPGQLLGPTGIAAGSDGSIYVADTRNHRIQKFDGAGNPLAQWGAPGAAAGQFTEPRGIGVDAKGNVYVADTGNRRIQKLSPGGDPLASWESGAVWLAVDSPGSVIASSGAEARIEQFDSAGTLVKAWGRRGTNQGELRSPLGVWVDSNGVTVADTDNHRIQQFNATGAVVRSWGGEGGGDAQFRHPSAVLGDSSGNLYVADTGNHRIQKFDGKGAFVRSWGAPGAGDGQFDRPMGLAFDGGGTLYVADTGNRRIQKFDANGRFLAAWGTPGAADGQLLNPVAVALDRDGSLYVADQATTSGGAPRVQKFDAQGNYVAKWISDGSGDLNPAGLAIDRNGAIFISGQQRITIPFTQTGAAAIVKLDRSGGLLQRFGVDGAGEGELSEPAGLVADASGNVYVADAGNHRVLKFASSVPTPTPAATPDIPVATPTVEGQPGAAPTPQPTPTPVPFGPPSPLEPPNTFRLPGPFTTLQWDQPFATQQFEVQVTPFNGDGPALDLIVGDRRLAGASRLALPQAALGRGPYLLLPDQTYTWRVRVSDSLEPLGPESGGWGPWSTAWTFRTPRTSSEGLSLVAPPIDGRVAAPTARLAWDNTAAEVFYYEVQVSTDPAFETHPVRATAAVWWNLAHGGQSLPLNSWQTPPLEPGRTFYWRVRPRIQGDGAPLAWGPTWRFSTAP